MASRKEVALISAARAGNASAQLILGKHYLLGVGLSKNTATALYWLDCAAQQGERDAWLLIGAHVPFEIALRAPQPLQLSGWYQLAFEAGNVEAGLIYAKLTLHYGADAADVAMRYRVLTALEAAARAGIAEAQLMLSEQLGAASDSDSGRHARCAAAAAPGPTPAILENSALEWATRAAENGVLQAQRRLAAHAWIVGDGTAFLRWSLPVARSIVQVDSESDPAPQLCEKDALLLSRCAKALFNGGDFDAGEVECFWKLAAQAGDRDAQLALGLWFAKMDATGNRSTILSGQSNYRKAIRWLTLAGEQGVANAWYALAKICLRPNTGLSQYGRADAQRYLKRAGEAGHRAAQLELGMNAWRTRRADASNDVRAVYWLQKAAAQGEAKAHALLCKIASCAKPAPWAQAALRELTEDLVNGYPFLAARIELAALLGLSRPEALLLDLNAADLGHCVEVDIRSQYRRGARRLILIQTGHERSALTRIASLFANIDCGPNGPEGHYLQRAYLFKRLFPPSGCAYDARPSLDSVASGHGLRPKATGHSRFSLDAVIGNMLSQTGRTISNGG